MRAERGRGPACAHSRCAFAIVRWCWRSPRAPGRDAAASGVRAFTHAPFRQADDVGARGQGHAGSSAHASILAFLTADGAGRGPLPARASRRGDDRRVVSRRARRTVHVGADRERPALVNRESPGGT